MRHLILLTASIMFLLSCGQDETKQKELELKEKELALKERELNLKERDTSSSKNSVDTTKKATPQDVKNSPNQKTMEMVFTEYSEGDLMHLIFKDIETGKEYDFGNEIDEKNFKGIKILLPDDNASFGYRANPKYLNKKFTVDAVYKSVLTSDPITGKGVKEKAWVINSLQQIN